MNMPTMSTRPDLGSAMTPPPAKPSRWMPFLLLILALLLGYLSLQWALGALIHSRPVVMVPELNGKSPADALNLLSSSRLAVLKEGEQFDKRFPAGTIVRQTPAAGVMVRQGHVVKITLSQGGETLFVPDLLGQPFRNAQTTLQNTGLGIGEVDHRPSLRFQKDEVMGTDPPAGSVVNKNALVNIVLSQGPPGSDVLLVPDFVGRQIAQVKSWGAQHQIPISVREEEDLARGPGEIILQSPVVDAALRPGDTLTVVVNTASASAGARGPRIRYQVPQGSTDRDIRILVIDEAGEREVYRKAETPGNRIDLPVTVKGRARARILSNGILVEEQELQ
jgi:eukaryotic-like serine/threonine-protein kinase